MNEDVVYKLIKPYIKNNTISYKVFFSLFHFLRKADQYQVINLIEDKFGIHVCDEVPEDSTIPVKSNTTEISPSDPEEDNVLEQFEIDQDTEDEFDQLYDKGAFINDNYPERTELNLKQSNERLCALIQEGDELAKEEICIKNKRLVYKYAYGYDKYYNHKLDFQDLVQVGFLGLLTGAEKFDISKGYQFSTYVVYWIKQQISREIMNNGYTIRIPVHMFEKIRQLDRVEEQLIDELKLDRLPKVEEIAEAMEMDVAEVRNLIRLRDQVKSTPSLDVSVGEDGDTPMWELIEDTFVEPTEALSEKIALYEIFDKALAQLSPKEQKIIRLRFGLSDGERHTLEEIGQMLGVTRERIRQIEAKAIRKLSGILKKNDLYLFFEKGRYLE